MKELTNPLLGGVTYSYRPKIYNNKKKILLNNITFNLLNLIKLKLIPLFFKKKSKLLFIIRHKKYIYYYTHNFIKN